MGLMSGITQLFTDLGVCMAFFAQIFSFLPLVIQLVIYFAFGGLVLFGLMKMIQRGL